MQLRSALCLAIPLLLQSCSQGPRYEASSASPAAKSYPSRDIQGFLANDYDAETAISPSTAPKRSASRIAKGEMAKENPSPTDEFESAASSNSYLHYEGYLRLEHRQADSVLNEAESLAVHLGGHTQSRSLGSTELLIPPSKFDTCYFALQTMAQVLDKSRSVAHLGDAVADNALRIRIASSSLDRLNILLSKAKTDSERISLLKEIQRIRDELESLQGQSRTLTQLVQFSQITINISAPDQRQNLAPLQEPIALAWISQWGNRNSSWSRLAHAQGIKPARIKLKQLGADFVEIPQEQKQILQFASASGTQIYSSTKINDPRGDLRFWKAVFEDKIGKKAAKFEWDSSASFALLKTLDWKNARQSPSTTPRTWYALRIADEQLDLLQIKFPNADQESRFGPVFKAALAKEFAP